MSVQVVYGKKQKAYTSHVERNGTFFLQLDNKDAYKLNDLSEDIARHIQSSGPSRIIPEFGMKCFACSADKAWYRALISSVSGNKVTVFYLDYGNTEELPASSLSAPIDSFFETPYQSVCCTIANFVPMGTDFGVKLKPLILERETSCEFVSRNDSKGHPFLHFLPCYNVLLYENLRSDVTLAEFLAKRSLGQYGICQDSTKVGSKQNVIVSFVDSPGKFWVQLADKQDGIEKLMEELNSPAVQSALKPLSQSALTDGAACCSLYAEDGRYYRAEITRKAGPKFKIWFGDYGNTETVAAADLLSLPHKLTRIPFAALMCSLGGVLPVKSGPHPKLGNIAWTPEASSAFSDVVLEQEFQADFVDELTPDVYTVNLSDANTGQDIAEQLAADQIVELSYGGESLEEMQTEFQYSSLEAGKTYAKLLITHVESPAVVWCQLAEHAIQMDDLSNRLLQAAPSLPELVNPEEGSPCCAQYSLDEGWYRGSIESVDHSSQTALVLFVDYGNSEQVSLSNVKVLPQDYFLLPAQAITFSMAALAPQSGNVWSDAACECFKSLVQDQELNCTVVGLDADGYPSVQLFDLTDPANKISQKLVDKGYAVALSSAPQENPDARLDVPTDFKYSSLKPGEMYKKVLITHVVSPAVVWCQQPKYAAQMEELSIQLFEAGPGLPQLVNPEEGSPCCAQYSVDKGWYRGSIESVDHSSQTALVLFVDYGNSEQVSLSNVKVLPQDYFLLPAQAITFSMAALAPRTGDDWSDAACECFKKMIQDKELNCMVVGLDGDGYPSVELCDPLNSATDIAQELVKRGLANGPSTAQSSLERVHADSGQSEPVAQTSTPTDFEYISLESGKTYERLYISHVVSPAVVWCQKPEYGTQLEDLSNKLLGAGFNLPKLCKPKEGSPCCAQYSLNEAWYRGSIESVDISSQTAQVLFVDYGNSEQVSLSNVKVLPRDYFSLPAQAISFSMAALAPRTGDDWNEAACECFKSLVQDRELNCTVVGLDDDGYPSVLLRDPLQGNHDIGQEFTQRGYAKCHLPKREVKSETSEVRMIPSGSQAKQPPKENQLSYGQIGLHPGSTCEVIIVHVQSCREFYCQITANEDSLLELIDSVHSYCCSNNSPAATTVVPNQPVLAMFSEDGNWYRAQVVQLDQDNCTVQFVDYGNSETVPMSTIKQMPEDLVVLPAQGIQCSLFGTISEQDIPPTTFSGMILEKMFTLTVKQTTITGVVADIKALDKPSVSQQLVNLGVLPPLQASPTKPVTIHPPQYSVYTPTMVVPSTIESPLRFYLQAIERVEAMQILADNLTEYYSMERDGIQPDVGCFCAAQFSEDGSWYRAKVIAMSGDQVEVKFIDYGNSETTTAASLKALHPQFGSTPCLAIPCCLYGMSEGQLNEQVTDAFHDLIFDQQVVAEFRSTFKDLETPVPVKLTVVTEGEVDILEAVLSAPENQPVVLKLSPKIATQHPCQVTHIVSCEEYYCQLSAEIAHFNSYMDELYKFYSEQNRGIELSKVSVGTYCAAPYTDGSWYRGKVSGITPQGVRVFYVDYGNNEVIPQSHLRALDPSFFEPHAQAIKCSLSNPQKFSSEEFVGLFEQITLNREAVITFCELISDGYYKTSLSIDGLDVCQILELSCQNVDSAPQQVMMPTVKPELNIPLQCTVSFINSCSDFYCQLGDSSDAFNALMDKLYSHYEGEAKGTPLTSPAVGSCCACLFTDGSWYRGVVQAINGEDASVYYVDYGNTEVVLLSKIYELDQAFCKFPIQAHQCTLSHECAFPEESSDHFYETIIEKQVEVTFTKQRNNKYEVKVIKDGVNIGELYQAQLAANNAQAPSIASAQEPAKQEPLHIMTLTPVLGTPMQCTVSYITSCGEFYCRLSSYSSQFQELMNSLYTYYREEGKGTPLAQPAVGDYCAAPFTDESWYRGVVMNTSPQSATVFYMDYGNTNEVELANLRQLDPQFCSLPTQAVVSSLSPQYHTEECTKLFNATLEETVDVVFIEQLPNASFLASLKLSGQNIEDTLGLALTPGAQISAIDDHLSAATEQQLRISETGTAMESAIPVYTEFMDIKPGESTEMYASHVNSPNQFWLQMPTADDILTVLQSDLTAAYEGTSAPILTNPEIGSACCTKFSVDGCWHRGVVMDVSAEGVTVCFVDYGNSELVNASQVYLLQSNFLATPVQAIECSFFTQSPLDFPEDVVETFSQLVADRELLVTFNSLLQASKWEVSIMEGGQDLKSFLFPQTEPAQSSPEASRPSVTKIPTLELKAGVTYSVYIAVNDSPSNFCCQLVSECEKLDELRDQIEAYYSSHKLEAVISVGAFCIAQYKDCWYRAKITAVHSDQDIEVSFVDYGNSEQVSSQQICGLDPKFSQLPVQGIPCSLIHDYTTMEFSNEVLQQFFQYNFDDEFTLKIRTECDGRYIVDLYQDGTHVNASVLGVMLSPSSQSPVDKQSYVHLKFGVGSQINAYISYINSPTSFYCQPLDLAEELESLMAQIATLMSSSTQPPIAQCDMTPGKICLSQYSEDNEWYRAMVKEVGENDITVLYVDYGNTEVTTTDKIVELPQQFQAFVVQSIHCSVFECTNMDWKAEITTQFQELVSVSDHVTVKISRISTSGQYFVDVSTNCQPIDFSALLEQQMDSCESQPPLRSLTAGPIIELPQVATDGSAASSVPLEESGTGTETESDNGSAGEPLIKAPFKLSLAVHESLDVNVVYVQSPDLMYIQRADCQNELSSLSEEIEQYCASFGSQSQKDFSLTFRKGDYVLAKYSEDETWYRAEVTGVDCEDGTTEVSFIDYGNVEVIPPEDLLMCPRNLLELPAQAISCSLAQVPRRDSWPFEYKELIHSLVDRRVLRATVVVPASQGMRPALKLEDVQHSVDLSVHVLLKLQDECEVGSNDVITELPEGEDLEEELPEELQPQGVSELPEPQAQAEATLVPVPAEPLTRLTKQRQIETGTTHAVSVISCESPHSFISQFTSEYEELIAITGQLSQLPEDHPGLTMLPKVDDVLAGQFSEDLEWYRAQVIDCDAEGRVEVTFIDYGNAETLTLDKLRYIPEDILAHPPMAVECFLTGIEASSSDGVFNEDSTAKFTELVGDGEASIDVVSVDTAGHLGVVLTASSGLNVGAALIENKLASPLILSPQSTSFLSPTKPVKESLPQESEEPTVTQAKPISVEEVHIELPKEQSGGAQVNEGHVKDDLTAALVKSTQHTNSNQNNSNGSSGIVTPPAAFDYQPELERASGSATPTDSLVLKLPVQCSDVKVDVSEVEVEDDIELPDYSSPEEGECVKPCDKSAQSFVFPESMTNGFSSNTNGNNNNDYATTYPSQNLAQGSRHQVKILSLTSPEDFVCVLIESADILKQLTTEIASNSEGLSVVSSPTPGMPVAMFNEKARVWCRASILSVGRSSTVKVYCVDTGLNDIVAPAKLKPLLKEYAELPPQAMRCQLRVLCESDLNPGHSLPGEPWELSWPSSCTVNLLELTRGKEVLYVEVVTVCTDGLYVVKLLDCSTEPAIDLRQMLVAKLYSPPELYVTSPPLQAHNGVSSPQSESSEDIPARVPASESVEQIKTALEAVRIEGPFRHSSSPEQLESQTSTSDHDDPANVQPMPSPTDEVPASDTQVAALNDSDFIDGETSASTGEGDRSRGHVCDNEWTSMEDVQPSCEGSFVVP